MYAKIHGGVLDEGFVQRILSLYEHSVSKKRLEWMLHRVPVVSLYLVSGSQSKVSDARKKLSKERILRWKEVLEENHSVLIGVLKEECKEVHHL